MSVMKVQGKGRVSVEPDTRRGSVRVTGGAASIWLALSLALPVEAAVLTVGHGGGYGFATIGGALAAAAPGDTIRVATGTYSKVTGEVFPHYLVPDPGQSLPERRDVRRMRRGPVRRHLHPAAHGAMPRGRQRRARRSRQGRLGRQGRRRLR